MELSILKNSGQNTLEICLAIIIGIMLLLGAVSTWSWFNKSMTERMDAYKATRHVALTTQRGKQINYTPAKLDILGDISTVGSSPADENPGLQDPADLQRCYDTFEEMMNQSRQLMNESKLARNESNDLLTNATNLKTELGDFLVFDIMSGVPLYLDKFNSWLFPLQANKFFTSSFEDIETYFIAAAPGHSFQDGSFRWRSRDDILVNYFYKGIDLENRGEAKIREAQEKEQQSDNLSRQAPILLAECLGGNVTPSDPCLDGCWQDYGALAQQQSRDAQIACSRGDFELCIQLFDQANQTSALYQNCTADCGLFNTTP